MSATGDPHRPAQYPDVAEAFRQIADIYVEASREATESDPDLCLDVPETSRQTGAFGEDSGSSYVAVDGQGRRGGQRGTCRVRRPMSDGT